jgi:hypothetical protein
MVHIENLDDNVKKTIVFPDLTKAEIKTYLKNVLNISDINRYQVLASDSLYNILNQNLTSEVYLYGNGQLYEHYLLKTYCPVKETEPFEIKIPDSIAISNAALLSSTEDFFFISDYTFRDCILINKKDHKVNIVTGEDLTSEFNFNKIAGDTITYYMFTKYKEDLKNANMDSFRLQPSFGSKNDMTTFLMAPDIREEDGDLTLDYRTGVLIYDTPNTYRILHIDNGSIPENYIVFPGLFSKYKENYYVQLIEKDIENDDQFLFGKFILENESLVFSEFCNYKLPSEYLPARKTKSIRKILTIAGPYVFLQYSLSYYDIDTRQTYQLPFDSVNLNVDFTSLNASSFKLNSTFKLIDADITNNTIKVLYKQSDKYYIAFIDRSNNSLIKNSEISIPAKSLKTWPLFYSSDELFYLSNDNVIIVEKIHYK